MRVLGIDYGEKRVGLAISDETQNFARELDILSPKDFFSQVNQLIKDYQISRLVIGWPLNMEGKETAKTQEVKKFKGKLENLTEIPIEIIDERLSSAMTRNLPGGKENKDSLAAKIILQNYLDKTKNQSEHHELDPNAPKGDNSENSVGNSENLDRHVRI